MPKAQPKRLKVVDSLKQAALALDCEVEMLQSLKTASFPGFQRSLHLARIKPIVDAFRRLDRPPPEAERLVMERKKVELESAKEEAEIRRRSYFRQADLAEQIKFFAAKRAQYRDRVRQRLDAHHQAIFDEADLHELGLLKEMVSGFAVTLDITIKGEVK